MGYETHVRANRCSTAADRGWNGTLPPASGTSITATVTVFLTTSRPYDWRQARHLPPPEHKRPSNRPTVFQFVRPPALPPTRPPTRPPARLPARGPLARPSAHMQSRPPARRPPARSPTSTPANPHPAYLHVRPLAGFTQTISHPIDRSTTAVVSVRRRRQRPEADYTSYVPSSSAACPPSGRHPSVRPPARPSLRLTG